MKNVILSLAMTFSTAVMFVHAANHQEKNGLLVIEAEHFATQHKDDIRRWIIFSEDSPQQHRLADNDLPHFTDASGGQYIEILPDTRTNHHETLVKGENFTNLGGEIAVLSYPAYFETTGTYYVWARSFSTGSEDNGIHIGLNNTWPESSQRLQLCEGKHKWTWSSAQRIKTNHCGTPNTITLNIPSPGVHNIMISMREDGFELDKLVLTTDKDFNPANFNAKNGELAETVSAPPALAHKKMFLDVHEYTRIYYATTDFTAADSTEIPLFRSDKHHALAIDSALPANQNKYAFAQVKIDKKDAGTRKLTLVTLAETGARSNYKVFLNDKEIGQFTNPVTTIAFQESYFHLNNINLKEGDIIKVANMAVSDDVMRESNPKSSSNGLWRALILAREK